MPGGGGGGDWDWDWDRDRECCMLKTKGARTALLLGCLAALRTCALTVLHWLPSSCSSFLAIIPLSTGTGI